MSHSVTDSIKVVMISDTHNHQPELPDGDLLVHSGDLSEWGSFDEIQKQLSWLSAQPHHHKVVVAGNHDILFDQKFLDSHKERFPTEPGKTAADLVFGDVIYLENSSTTLTFPRNGNRRLTLYGSPLTPRYIDSAFQYAREDDVWEALDLTDIDILITHGPAWGHLDGITHSGCQYLAHAIARWKPRLHVFGHIHVGYGRESVRYDLTRLLYEDVQRGWEGWGAILLMAFHVLYLRVVAFGCWTLRIKRQKRTTEHVNAAVVGENNRLCNDAAIAYM